LPEPAQARKETVGDLGLLATSNDAAVVGARLAAYENVAQILARGPSRTTIVLRSGLQVDLRVVADVCDGAALILPARRPTTSLCASSPTIADGS